MGLEAARIPNGWAHASLEAVCQILDSRRIPINNSERSQRIAGKSADDLYPYYGATGQVGVIDDFIFDGEHVLLGEDGAPFLDPFKAKSYLVDGKFWVNNHAHILKSAVPNKYLCHYLNQIDYSDHVTGTTRLKLTQNALKRIPVLVAHIAEQRRIIAKIEELFSELDKGVESLKTARAQLNVYRQAVLKHAFEGKLTARWREENRDKLETPEQLLARIKQEREARYEQQLREWKAAVKKWEEEGKSGKKPQRPKKLPKVADIGHDVTLKLPPVPESWLWEKLGWMTCGVEYGTAAKSTTTGGVPVLRMGNIQNAKFDWENLVYTSDDNEIVQYLLRDGDVLFNRTNSPELVGKTAIYKSERPAVFAGYLIRVNHIGTVVDSQYLNLFLNSHVARQYGNYVKTDGVNQSNINGAKLSNYPFPYCSIKEQREIARILEKILSFVDETEGSIDQKLLKAGALRQSILNQAFSGQLVAQDPHDEPASILLDRIRAEKEKATANNHSKKTKKQKTTA